MALIALDLVAVKASLFTEARGIAAVGNDVRLIATDGHWWPLMATGGH